MEGNHNAAMDEFLRMIIEKQGTDILFECFAGLVARSEDLDSNNIHVIPKENYRRSHKNDIIQAPREDKYVPEHYVQNSDFGYLTMFTSRSSILDYLPEDFYTEADNKLELKDESGRKRSKEEIKLIRERRKKELESALRFFRPLEVEYNKVRIQRELHEIEQLENFDGVLEAFWQEFPIADDRWRRFVRTLHLASHVVGDIEKTKSMIEYVLETPVQIKWEVEASCKMSEEEQKSLTGEKVVLGFNVNLGSTVYDYLETCVLKIEDLSTSEFFGYFDEQSENRQLLNEIIKHYFPLNVDVRLDFSINPKKGKTDGEEAVMVLGYSSTLG